MLGYHTPHCTSHPTMATWPPPPVDLTKSGVPAAPSCRRSRALEWSWIQPKAVLHYLPPRPVLPRSMSLAAPGPARGFWIRRPPCPGWVHWLGRGLWWTPINPVSSLKSPPASKGGGVPCIHGGNPQLHNVQLSPMRGPRHPAYSDYSACVDSVVRSD